MGNDWQNSWPDFVQAVGQAYVNGATNADVTRKFGDHDVRWKGLVRRVRLDDNQARKGLRIRMPRVEVPYKEGKVIACDTLYLSVDDSTSWMWGGVEPGQTVEFEAKIPNHGGAHPTIELDIDEDDNECYLLVGLIDAARVLE